MDALTTSEERRLRQHPVFYIILPINAKNLRLADKLSLEWAVLLSLVFDAVVVLDFLLVVNLAETTSVRSRRSLLGNPHLVEFLEVVLELHLRSLLNNSLRHGNLLSS